MWLTGWRALDSKTVFRTGALQWRSTRLTGLGKSWSLDPVVVLPVHRVKGWCSGCWTTLCSTSLELRGEPGLESLGTKPQSCTDRKDRLHHEDGPVTKKPNLLHYSIGGILFLSPCCLTRLTCFVSVCRSYLRFSSSYGLSRWRMRASARLGNSLNFVVLILLPVLLTAVGSWLSVCRRCALCRELAPLCRKKMTSLR
jgi:hypothetical protein